MSNENKIRILYVQPGKYPEERLAANELHPLQQLVGGYMRAVYPWSKDNVALVCNDSGKLYDESPVVLSYSADSLAYAIIICSIIPVLAIYPYIQKYFAKGVNMGGVKG